MMCSTRVSLATIIGYVDPSISIYLSSQALLPVFISRTFINIKLINETSRIKSKCQPRRYIRKDGEEGGKYEWPSYCTTRPHPSPTHPPISPWKAWKEGYGKSHFPPASFLHLFRDCPCSLIGLLLIWYLIA